MGLGVFLGGGRKLLQQLAWRISMNTTDATILSQASGPAPYIVRGSGSGPLIEAWSSRRLPYEPKGWLLHLRSDLRTAIAPLQAGPDQVLHAVYGSMDTTYCDAENILIYNVGPGYVAAAGAHGLRLERTTAVPPAPAPLAAGTPHYHRYELVERDAGFQHWRRDAELAAWTDIVVPPLKDTTCLATIWWQLRTGALLHHSQPAPPPARFGLRLALTVPAGTRFRPPSALKPLLDGTIAAFHAHTGNDAEPPARVAAALKQDADATARLLRDDTRAVLGGRCLVWNRSDGVQWNPADDKCEALEVLVQTHPQPTWLCSGSLFTLQPAQPATRVDAREGLRS